MERSAQRGAGRSGDRRLGRAADAGVPAAGDELLAAADARGARRAAVQEPAPADRGGRRPARAGGARPAPRHAAGQAGAMTHSEFALLDEARGADRPGAAHVRPRRGRRGAEPHADGAADGRPPRPPAVADRARRHRAAHRRGAAEHLGAPCWGRRAWTGSTIEELLVSYRVPDDFLRIASALAPGTDRARAACEQAPWAAVAVRTHAARARWRGRSRRGWQADVGSVGVIVPAALHDERGRGARAGRDRGRGGALERRQPARPRGDQGARVRRGRRGRAAAILDERPDGGRGGLYTALTRSTRALAVVHAEPLPDVLAGAGDLRPVPEAGAAEAWAAGRRSSPPL